jgi:hypothetical protein
VVDEDPILASDVERVIALGLAGEPADATADGAARESDDDLRRRVLDQLIEERLRFHEVERVGLAQVPIAEIETQVELIRSRFATEEAFQERLRDLALSEEGLRQLVSRQLAILSYLDERLGARIFISLDDIRRYYEEELRPALAAKSQPLPPIEDVRESIRGVLRARQLNEEVIRWTAELQRKADVVDLRYNSHDDLPPVVQTIATPPPE